MSELFKKTLLLFIAVSVLEILNSCTMAQKQLNRGDVFFQDNGDKIRIVSEDELKIEKGKNSIEGKYTIAGDRMRVSADMFGRNDVSYYKITSDGLVKETGEIFYNKTNKKQNTLDEIKNSFVLVTSGCYKMGDVFGDGSANEKPVHEVCVDDFFIGKYEVTQLQWQNIMGNNPSWFKGCDNCPVESVSWNDIQDFIYKINQITIPSITPNKEGQRGIYRLPTEAEWEYSARSRGQYEKYMDGSDIENVAWFEKNSGARTHPVGEKGISELGLYDMSGNVWEWVADWYHDNYYNNSPRNNPTGFDSGQFRVLRGGSWSNDARESRTTNRVKDDPAHRYNNLGFRLAVSAK